LKIAVEEHYVPEALENYLKSKNNPSVSRFSAGRKNMDKRLQDMSAAGIDFQVLSVGLMGIHELKPADGAAMAMDIDNELAEVAAVYPGKFAAFASIAPQGPDAAAGELERAVKVLGMKGAMINSHINGEYLDEDKYRSILQAAAGLDVPIYIHPNLPPPDMIKPYLKYPILPGAFWGFAAETGLHAMRLICSGVFDELPNLKIILGHMGEALPFWLWRLDAQWEHRIMAEGTKDLKKKPSQYIKENFYFATSGMFWPTAIQFVTLAVGAERIMFGVDYPIESNGLAVEAVENTPISDTDKEKIFCLNAKSVLRI
jgi:5-carboxyvanillate decarboxylase